MDVVASHHKSRQEETGLVWGKRGSHSLLHQRTWPPIRTILPHISRELGEHWESEVCKEVLSAKTKE